MENFKLTKNEKSLKSHKNIEMIYFKMKWCSLTIAEFEGIMHKLGFVKMTKDDKLSEEDQKLLLNSWNTLSRTQLNHINLLNFVNLQKVPSGISILSLFNFLCHL